MLELFYTNTLQYKLALHILLVYLVMQDILFLFNTLAIQDSEKRCTYLSNTQMLKGILDGCLLAIIQEGEVYGYELAEKLETYGFQQTSEGTIYPLLIRMQKEELVTTTLKKSTAGPRRKYYSLTKKGEEELEAFIERWSQLSRSVDQILKKKGSGK